MTSQTTPSKQPLISIIIPIYNAAPTLQRCLDSIHSQTYPYKELIIMDAGSTDGSIEIIKNNEHSITYWESQADKGIHHAWNKALAKTNGDWIYFLGADDFFWGDTVLSKIAAKIEEIKDRTLIVYGKVAQLQSDGTLFQMTGDSWDKLQQSFIQGITIDHQAIFHHRELFRLFGNFKEDYLICGDYELLLRYLKDHDPIFIDETIAGRPYTGISSQAENILTLVKERMRARQDVGLNSISPTLIFWYLKAKLRTTIIPLFGVRNTQKVVNIYRRLIGKKAIT